MERCSILLRRGVILQARIAPDLPSAIADREKIELVLVNLADNAMKYTPDNGRILFAAQREGHFVRFRVTDTGPGIPPGERQRVFERFAQVSGDKVARRGFGLGLTYCRLAVERHGGRIWVEPGENGLGSCFVFTLPISPSTPDP